MKVVVQVSIVLQVIVHHSQEHQGIVTACSAIEEIVYEFGHCSAGFN